MMGTLLLGLIIAAIIFWIYVNRHLRSIKIRHLPEQFVIFDLETTGLDPSKHQIIEIGAIRVNRDSKQHDTFQALIITKRKLPKKIVELTGITDDLIKSEGITLEEALVGFRDFIGDLRLIAFNADFDLGFLHKAATQHNLEFRNPTSCALRMARKAWPGRRSYKLADLARDGNISLSNQHRALSDCERTVHVYIAAASKLRSI